MDNYARISEINIELDKNRKQIDNLHGDLGSINNNIHNLAKSIDALNNEKQRLLALDKKSTTTNWFMDKHKGAEYMGKADGKSKSVTKGIKLETKVISAFPACGKTYAFEHFQDYYSMLDSDSSQFSWLKDANGNNTKERNPDFPQNYIQHIKDNIGKVEIIFVSSHENVRKAMNDAGISFYTVYPKETMLNEWVGRMYRRGNDHQFIKFIIDNWDSFMKEIERKENFGVGISRLGNNEYIDLSELTFLYNW